MRFGKHPGRLRDKLAVLLLKHGLIVSPYDLWVQEGGYRRHTWDLACWGSNDAAWVNETGPNGKPYCGHVLLCSWDTMTRCCRYGIEISNFDGEFSPWGHVEVHSARPPKPQ
jgi:hypothetical protein